MSQATLQAVHPVLPARDVQALIDYYVTRLGFALAFQDVPVEPGYAGVRRDGVELHIQWHDPAEWATVERPSLRFVVSHVEALFEEYQGKDVFHAGTQLRETAWNTREFAFFDPEKNALTFYCDL